MHESDLCSSDGKCYRDAFTQLFTEAYSGLEKGEKAPFLLTLQFGAKKSDLLKICRN